MLLNNKRFAVYEKTPKHGKYVNGIVLAPFKNEEDAQKMMVKFGYNNENYFVGEMK